MINEYNMILLQNQKQIFFSNHEFCIQYIVIYYKTRHSLYVANSQPNGWTEVFLWTALMGSLGVP